MPYGFDSEGGGCPLPQKEGGYPLLLHRHQKMVQVKRGCYFFSELPHYIRSDALGLRKEKKKCHKAFRVKGTFSSAPLTSFHSPTWGL